ncbi:TPA: hypothetical protein QDC22_000846 [Burkholderia stabilis]|nr:hypothetical protein [Burkholderia stabilis]HDR9647031.1 hypothetical protein [Burkholderia stabilis]HDR9677565.1 hypothetical protein [Burkholderia stabilis]
MHRRKFLQKTAALGASTLLPFTLQGCGGESGSGGVPGASNLAVNKGAQPLAKPQLTLTSHLNDTTVSRDQVLQWEARRVQVVANKMKNNLPAYLVSDLAALIVRPPASIAHIDQERNALADAKIRAGHAAMKSLVAADLLVSDPLSTVAASTSFGNYAPSRTEVTSNRGTAEGFTNWFLNKSMLDFDERSMLVACPDHYFFAPLQPKGQDVMEETGGALIVTHFTVDYDHANNLPQSDIDLAYPIRLAGMAVNGLGSTVGGVMHQFRDLDQGFQCKLAVYFPGTLPFWTTTEHAWHLACEFSNWITAYIAETGD